MTQDWLVPLMLLMAFTGGVGVGLIAGLRSNSTRRHARWLERELEKTRNEITDYQRQVTSHFAETARIFNTLSDNYQAVYHHLASGCQELCRGEHPQLTHRNNISPIESAAPPNTPANKPGKPSPPGASSHELAEGLGIG